MYQFSIDTNFSATYPIMITAGDHLQLRQIGILQKKLSKSCRRQDLHNHINKSPTTISFYLAHICKRLWSPGIDSKLSNPLAYIAWSAGTTNKIVVLARHAENRFLACFKCLQIRALGINKIQFQCCFYSMGNMVTMKNITSHITRIYMEYDDFQKFYRVFWYAGLLQTPCL